MVYAYVRERGLISFLPVQVQSGLQSMTIFDILVAVFIERHFTKKVGAVVGPFMKAESAAEAKAILKQEGIIS